MIRLIGPGGAGKSTIGALLAERLDVAFLDLDRHFAGRVGDISEYIGRHGYDAYARENVEAYCSLFRGGIRPDVVALSSGFMTYASDTHREYGRIRRERPRLGFRPRTSCAKTNSRSHQALPPNRYDPKPHQEKPLAGRTERRRSRAPPGPSCLYLLERRGNQAFPRVRITNTRSGLETKIGCALPAQSLAGTATHERRETDVWRVGQTVRAALSAQEAIRQDSPREIPQLHE
jgi:hypothetical protein